jgi:hypothetical protein
MNLNDQSGNSSYYPPPIPVYKRLRKVTLLHQNRVDCSCGCATDMRMPCRHILAVFDESKLIMWHVMWHKAFQTDYARNGMEKATKLYDEVLKEVDSKGVSYDGCEMDFLHDSCYPVFTRRSNHLLLEQMNMVDVRQETDHPMTVRAGDAGDVINIPTLEGYDIQTHQSPFAVSVQAKAPTTPTNDSIPIFDEEPTPASLHMETNEKPYSYLQKWFRELEKDLGPRLGLPSFKKELDNVRQNLIAEAEHEAKGKRGRESDNNQLNPLDFDSFGLECNKTARRLKPFFERYKK